MGLNAISRFFLTKNWQVCFIAGALFITDLSLAEGEKNQTWYQIEVIVATRIAPDDSLEFFPSDPAPIPSGSRVLAEFNADIGNPFQLDNEEFISLPLDLRILNNEANALTDDDRYDVLLHQSWRQILTGNKAINWIDIKGGHTWGGHQQLEGRLGFSKGRFLHIFSDLHLNQFQSLTSDMSQRAIRNPLHDTKSTIELGIKARYSLVQRRKMRSKELHYLDHPKLVLLVKVIPYTPAQTMITKDSAITTIPAIQSTSTLSASSSLVITPEPQSTLAVPKVPSNADEKLEESPPPKADPAL